jgi:aspartate aminotransferase-like enzyme
MFKLLAGLEEKSRPLFGTKHDILTLASSGSGSMESAVVNLTSPGDEIIVVVGGAFSQRWADIGKGYGLKVRTVEVDTRQGARLTDIEQALKQWPNAEVIFITWSESATGVLIELSDIGKLIRSQNKILVADAVSGLAVSPLKMDDWHIDSVIAGSQKGLMLPPGLALVAAGPRAWEKRQRSNMPRFYWDWLKYKNNIPFTPAHTLMFQLDASLDYIHKEGPERIFERRAQVATIVRDLVRKSGLEVYALNPGNGITGVIPDPTFDIPGFIRRLETNFGIQIAGGLGSLEGKIFRIGHVGHLTDEEVDYFVQSFTKSLS